MINESVVLCGEAGDEDLLQNVLRNEPHGRYEGLVRVNGLLEQCALLSQLRDLSIYTCYFFEGIHEKGAYFKDFGIRRNIVRVQSICEGGIGEGHGGSR